MTEAQPPDKRAPDVRMIPMSQIKAVGNVRETRDEDLQELVASIKAQGLQQAVLVTSRATTITGNVVGKDGRPAPVHEEHPYFRLVYGFRRFRACQLAGLQEIKAEVRDMTDEEVLDAQLVENEAREDLNAIEEARGFQRRLEAGKITQAELGKRIGKSQPFIANRLRLLELRPEVQDEILRGILSPSAGELLLAVPKEASGLQGKIAKEVVKGHLPVQDLRRHVEHEVARWKQDQVVQDALTAAKAAGAKVLSCPLCDPYGRPDEKRPEKFYVLEGRPVLQHTRPYYDEAHRWYGDTGEQYFTPAERKEIEREKAAEKKRRSAAAKGAAKKGEATRAVKRDYAVFFSRARINAWAQALLEAHMDAELDVLEVGNEGRWGNLNDFSLDVKNKLKLPYLNLTPAEVSDGNGGKFFTRVQIGEYRSTPSDPDNVAEDAEAALLAKQRKLLLEFQSKEIGVKQAADDLWPTKWGGFELGQKVRIGDKAAWSSYRGKQGVIVAFDVEDWLHGTASHKEGQVVAVLNIGAAHKRHALEVLEPLEVKKA